MQDAAATAAWLAEAWETGNPLAPFPPELAPADRAEGEAVAAALVERLGLPVCGVRLVPAPDGGWVSAPLPAPRLLRAGTPVSLAALRHARLSAGFAAVLGAPLEEEGEGPAAIAALHPVIDVAAERYREPAADAAHLAADLGGVGVVLAGKRAASPCPAELDARLGPTGARPRPLTAAAAALLAEAVAAARRWGGLPAGAVLVVAGLGGAPRPAEAGRWLAALGPVGRITVTLA